MQQTIKSIYTGYYPEYVVNFFCRLHDSDNIGSDINAGKVRILTSNGRIVATGSRSGNHIARVFVASDCLNNGYGSIMMNRLEYETASENYDRVCLETSVPAKQFYLNRGYKVYDIRRIIISDGNHVFEYEAMEKIICK